jgi:hypothetical protein
MIICACICHESIWGSGGVASLILNLGAGWGEWLVSCSAVAYPGIFSGGGLTNSVEDRENGDLGTVAP